MDPKGAGVKQAFVRVYYKNDNTYKTIPITPQSTPADVCEMFAKKVSKPSLNTYY
jgi:hypothetical protein